MTNTELAALLEELTALPAETEWVEFKLGKSLTSEQIKDLISSTISI